MSLEINCPVAGFSPDLPLYPFCGTQPRLIPQVHAAQRGTTGHRYNPDA